MGMSEEIKNVLDDLAQRLGVAIDWTSENVMPYLQDLMTRFIKYQNTLAIFAICVWVIGIIVSMVGLIKIIKYQNKRNEDWYAYNPLIVVAIIIFITIIIFGIPFIMVNIVDLIQNIYMPELTIIEYVKNLNL